ncbi:MAG: hypothetical protein OXL37_04990 [Chloroflexota bacterium]|nr:hypothetical protein [Chloroflexota bacterium]MDE2959663.1 hypothetical protein [Chloroflexota bacterium]
MSTLVESLETIVAHLRVKHAATGRELEMGERMLAEAKAAAAGGGMKLGRERSDSELALGTVTVSDGGGFLVPPTDSKGRAVYDVRAVMGRDGYGGKGQGLVEVYGPEVQVHGMGQVVFASGETQARSQRDVVSSCRGIPRFNKLWSKGERGKILYLGDITVNEELVNVLAGEGKGRVEPWVQIGGDVEGACAEVTVGGGGLDPG